MKICYCLSAAGKQSRMKTVTVQADVVTVRDFLEKQLGESKNLELWKINTEDDPKIGLEKRLAEIANLDRTDATPDTEAFYATLIIATKYDAGSSLIN